MIDGLSGDELKILDPFNEHRNDYVYLRVQACYPEIYRTVKAISNTGLFGVFLILCGCEDNLDKTRMLMFDYDSGDIVGVVGTQKMYSTIVDTCCNLPRYFYFVDDKGNYRQLSKSDTEIEMKQNAIGKIILKILADMYERVEEAIMYGEKMD